TTGFPMHITTTARHLDVDGAVKEFIEKRLAKLEHFTQDIREAHVILSLEKYRYTAEIILRLNRHELMAREETGDALASVDRAVDNLEGQLRKWKERRAGRVKGETRLAASEVAGGATPPAEEGEPENTGLAGGSQAE